MIIKESSCRSFHSMFEDCGGSHKPEKTEKVEEIKEKVEKTP